MSWLAAEFTAWPSLNCGMGINSQVTGLQDQYLSNMKSSGKEGTLKILHCYTESYIEKIPTAHHQRASPAQRAPLWLQQLPQLPCRAQIPNALRGALPSSAHSDK